MSIPLLRQQDAAHVRMSGEFDAEHVEHFPLQPVGGEMHADGGFRTVSVRNVALHSNALVSGKAVDDVDQVEALGPLGPIDGGEVYEVIEIRFGFQVLDQWYRGFR